MTNLKKTKESKKFEHVCDSCYAPWKCNLTENSTCNASKILRCPKCTRIKGIF